MAGLFALGIAPHVGLFVGPIWSRVGCGAGVVAIAAALAASKRGSGIGWPYALTMPLAAVAIMIALARSVVLTLARGGVVWRDHLYPPGPVADARPAPRHLEPRGLAFDPVTPRFSRGP